MPNWIKVALVLIVVIVIIGGSILVFPPYFPPPPGPTKGDVYVVQTDRFYCSVNANVTPNGQLLVDYMQTRFGVGTYNGTQPLHVTVLDTFNDNRNITVNQPFVWDYFGNCYKLNPKIDARSIRFDIGGIYPALVNKTLINPAIGNPSDFGTNYWSLYFGYLIDSANDSLLANDHLSDLFALKFTISNSTLVYGIPTLVNCCITLLPPTDGIEYSDGLAYIQFPTKVYNGTELLANITLQAVDQVGTAKQGTYTSNQSLITMRAPFSFLANNSWGFVFSLNVTSYAGSRFCLLDLSSPECQFFLRAGFRNSPLIFDQPMHFPKASVTINTPYQELRVVNYTEVYLRLPQVWLNAVHVGNSTPVFVPLVVQPSRTTHQQTSCSAFENSPKMPSCQTAPLFTPSSQLVIWAAVTPVLERLRRTPLI